LSGARQDALRWPAGVPALVILAGGLAGASRLRSYDLFWHLETGRRILESGAVFRTDPFSFTAPGTPWVDHSWLFQIVAWLAWAGGGAWGPWLLQAATGAALAALFLWHLSRWRVPPAAAVALTLVALQGARFRLTFRPELATLLLAALAAALLVRHPSQGRALAPLWVPPLAALWMNLHGGAVLAPLMVGAALAGEAGGRLLPLASAARPEARRLGILLLALPLTVAALLLNPYGYRVLQVPFQVTRIVGQSWAPNPEWRWPEPSTFPLLYLCVAGLVVVALARWRRADPGALALGLLGAVLALRYVRNVGVFFVLLPFAAAPLLGGVRSRQVRPWLVRGLALAGAGWIALAPAWLALGPPAGPAGPGLEEGRYPVEACDFVERQRIDGRLFNEVAFGGYLIWRFPGRPVFIDGRNEIYPELLRDIHAGLQDVQEFWELMERWQIQAAVLRYPAERPVVAYPQPGGGTMTRRRAWSEIYFPRPDWALVHWDDTAMVRVRRREFDDSWLAEHEIRHLNPDDWPYLLEQVRAGRARAADLLADVERKLAEDPECRRALELRARLQALPAGEVQR
jgi:hypothetical protein